VALTSAAPETARERRRAEGRRGQGSSSPWREEGNEWAERGSRRRWHRAAAVSSRRREGVEHEGSAPLSPCEWRRQEDNEGRELGIRGWVRVMRVFWCGVGGRRQGIEDDPIGTSGWRRRGNERRDRAEAC